MSKIYTVYKLINPVTNDVFYVGKTSMELNQRLKIHISNSRFGTNPINIYIKELKINPVIIEICKDTKYGNKELENIIKYSKDYILYNTKIGDMNVKLSEYFKLCFRAGKSGKYDSYKDFVNNIIKNDNKIPNE